jgi:hypothetical protein
MREEVEEVLHLASLQFSEAFVFFFFSNIRQQQRTASRKMLKKKRERGKKRTKKEEKKKRKDLAHFECLCLSSPFWANSFASLETGDIVFARLTRHCRHSVGVDCERNRTFVEWRQF